MDQPTPASLRLAFHIESADTAAESLKDKVAKIEGVRGVEARVLQQARAIDAQSVATILVLVTATTKAGVTATAHIEEIIRNVKKIGAESGITKIYLEYKRRKHDINLVGPAEMRQIAETASSDSQSGS